ncbi:bifunctional 2-polyprenyl-6-hydroxyphenol methylase/3-demethylubiquinol 3-O-methyltransferase UbiG [Pseudonocardia sp. MH-G8]|uniref:class I SAM-dependent methyltransferase n=1 Tax=Pseudonocardia sp. MH-G8 TaxID=1854588 RepID=UPI000B9FE277|nr:class I SAM-dependent methyltransferase [Pseudonocardia sp. MH-G8]OZM76428.1 methyltransferase type 11 [Pseudonocardia sp. MH-G8]
MTKRLPLVPAVRTAVHGCVLRVLQGVGFRRSDAAIEEEAQRYWSEAHQGRGSHWQSTSRFTEGELWTQIGLRHLGMLRQAARTLDAGSDLGRVVEWGCGGGANAVQIAPLAREFVGVDVSPDSLQECTRQVLARCGTPFQPVLVDVRDPEAALQHIAAPCDVFLCVYVFELIPSPAYGERLLRIAHEILAPGAWPSSRSSTTPGRGGPAPAGCLTDSARATQPPIPSTPSGSWPRGAASSPGTSNWYPRTSWTSATPTSSW